MTSLKYYQKIILIIIFILGLPASVILVRSQQDTRQKANETGSTIKLICSVDQTVDIQIAHINTTTEIVDVAAKIDLTGNEVSLGTANPGDSVVGVIHTGIDSIQQGNIIIKTSNNELRTIPFQAFDCPKPNQPACINDQAVCTWDLLENTTQYSVVISEEINGKTIKSGLVNHPGHDFSFPIETGKSYICQVIPLNSCGQGIKANFSTSCPILTPKEAVGGSEFITPKAQNTVSIVQPTVIPTTLPTVTPTKQPVATLTPAIRITEFEESGVGLGVNYFLTATPTPIKVLPPTGLAQDLITITIIGCAIVLMGTFVVIFLW